MESTRIYLNEPLVRSLAASSDTRSASKFSHSTLRGVAGVERESTLFQLCESIPAAGQILRVCILFPGRVCTLFNTLRTMSSPAEAGLSADAPLAVPLRCAKYSEECGAAKFNGAFMYSRIRLRLLRC